MEMKVCRKCGEQKMNGRCRKCANDSQRRWVEKHKQQHLAACKKWRDEHPDVRAEQKARWYRTERGRCEAKAAWTAWNAIKTGEIVPAHTCAICGRNGPLEMHHEDYARPMEVDWLCQSCHGAVRSAANELVRIAQRENELAIAS